jgi:hypothetical protein
MSHEPILERLARDITGILHRHPYHDLSTPPGATTASPPERRTAVANAISDIHQLVTDGIANIKGWAEDLEQKLPEVAAKAESFESSPIVQALEGAVLSPAVEQEIANLIKRFAEVMTPANASGTPSPTAPADGTPAPADAAPASTPATPAA